MSAIAVILVGIGLGVMISQRARRSAVIESQFQRLNRLASALLNYAKAHNGAFPLKPDEIFSGAELTTVMTDAQSGQPLIYRVAPATGEPIRYDFLGDRIIAWSPSAGYRGTRAVLLNNGDVKFAPDDVLDLAGQRFRGSDRLNQMVPKVSSAEPEVELDAKGDDGSPRSSTAKDD